VVRRFGGGLPLLEGIKPSKPSGRQSAAYNGRGGGQRGDALPIFEGIKAL
jgi:hypothetical protein